MPTKEIPLTQGQVAIVDECDFERVSAIKWHAVAREAFDVVKKLVALRTPETVARMDRERGLK